ncbi:MAG: SDR family oxidoreductase [Bacteroidetes bacterium]|nr:SDR family oxidoreductase [Bacteroidota bacterium]
MKDKIVIITGASSGIGEACAHVFGKAGAKLVLAARNQEKLLELSTQLSTYGVQALPIVCDVRLEKDCEALVQKTIAHYGQIDVLINNAGISMRALFRDADLKVLEALLQTNFWGAVYCTKFALPFLLKTKGSIIGVNSWAGFTGLPGRTGYSASKFALLGFMEALRVENLKTGLHIGSIFPGYTTSNIRNTALNANGQPQQDSPLDENKLMSANEVAQNILKMVQKRRKYHILTTTGKLMYWINKLFPNYIDREVYKVISKEKNSPF